MYNYLAEVSAFENLNIKSKSTAALEIITMLVGSFLLGYLLHWLFCRARHSSMATRTTTHTSRTSVSNNMAAPAVRTAVPSKPDDLKVIEGIGPKIETLLNAAGIMTFAQLARSSVSSVKTILDEAGPRFQMHDPSTWMEQAALARDGKMVELDRLKDRLTAGRA